MKVELGMFPSEIVQICNFLEIFHLMKNPERIKTLTKEIGFPIALKFARLEHLIPSCDSDYQTFSV